MKEISQQLGEEESNETNLHQLFYQYLVKHKPRGRERVRM